MRAAKSAHPKPGHRITREAVGVFHNHDALEDAVAKLEMAGFSRHQISVLGSEHAMRKRFGTPQAEPEKLQDNPRAPRSINITHGELGIAKGALIGGTMYLGAAAAMLASGAFALPGGMVVAALAGGAGGGAIGAMLANLLGEKYAEFFQKQIDKGGLVLWVNTPTPEREEAAQEILRTHGAENIHIHDINT